MNIKNHKRARITAEKPAPLCKRDCFTDLLLFTETPLDPQFNVHGLPFNVNTHSVCQVAVTNSKVLRFVGIFQLYKTFLSTKDDFVFWNPTQSRVFPNIYERKESGDLQNATRSMSACSVSYEASFISSLERVQNKGQYEEKLAKFRAPSQWSEKEKTILVQ